MHSDSSALRDIERNVDLAIGFTEGLSFDGFADDIRTVYAVIRCLEIVSEASRRLSPDLKERHPQIPWKDVAGSGNVYRHEYEDVLAEIIWDTVRLALPPLRAVVTAELG